MCQPALSALSILELSMISVVIPTCERPELVTRCLANLTGADEIIVSDDSRTDRTCKLIREKFPGVKWVRGPHRGPAANRNFGARQASGDLIAFVDDDCIPSDLWVNNLRRALAETNLVEGKTICPDRTNHPLEEVVENLSGGLLWSCNFGIRRALFSKLGGFDEDFQEAGGEDLEFAWRVRQNGVEVVFAPEAVVYHPARRLTLRRWLYRIFQDRWHLLYRLKTIGPRSATFEECKDLVRVTRRLIRDRGTWKTRFLAIVTRWILFPVWLLYLMKWECRFRKELANRDTGVPQVFRDDAAARTEPRPTEPRPTEPREPDE
jgi:GT2 family glycosyltransferase